MKRVFVLLALGSFAFSPFTKGETAGGKAPVYVIPIQDEIEQTMVYVVRRGLNEAIDHHAQAIILDMNTPGGLVSEVEKIMSMLDNFKGETITFVNNKAFSGGAFIAVATRHIYMAPTGVIGAAAPIMMVPGGGIQEMPGVERKKMSSALSALIRAAAQRNGHNAALVDAMVKETDGLTIDGKEIVKKGEILTLTVDEATALYGKPPKPLLAEGEVGNLDELIKKLGFSQDQIHRVEPTGAENLARLITLAAPVLLIVGLLGIYLEFKMPGVVLPGVLGVVAFALLFFGHYVAGLSGFEEIALFVFGLAMIAVEIFILPGHILPGFIGIVAIFVSILWTMVEKMPGAPGLPDLPHFEIPLYKLAIAILGAGILATFLARWLPERKGPMGGLILQTQLGSSAGYASADAHGDLVGKKGVTLSLLRPSGTACFGDRVVDVITQGDFIPANENVVVREVRGAQVIVERAP